MGTLGAWRPETQLLATANGGAAMTFVTAGLAIAGLCAVAVPILIHLLARQRRKPIEWAAMRFLIEAFKKHRRRLQLEQLVLLTVRCLIVALLGAALARPILESAGLIKTGGPRTVYLLIDNGMASGVVGSDNRTALSRHVKQAAEIVKTLGPGDAVGVITAARPAKALLVPPSTDHHAVLDLLSSIGGAPKDSPTDLASAFGFVRGAVDDARKSHQQTLVYLFSEFRSGSAALDAPLPATGVDPQTDVKLLASPPAADPLSNVQITSIDPVRNLVLSGANDGSGQVTVRLKRTGGAGQLASDVTRVRLVSEGLGPIEPKVVQWSPGESTSDVDFILNFPPATDRQVALTAMIDDDALNTDNQRHVILDLRSQLRVLLVDRRSFGFERTLDRLSAGQWIRRALEPLADAATALPRRGQSPAAPIQVVEAEPAAIDLPDVRSADVVIVPRPDLLTDAGWQVLRQFVTGSGGSTGGGLLIVVPPADVNVHQWTEHLNKDLDLPWRINLEVTEYKDGLALAQEQPRHEILRMISSELSELISPIRAYRVLAVDRQQTQAQPLLNFADGSPMLMASELSAGHELDAKGGGGGAAGAGGAGGATSGGGSHGLVMYLAAAPELSWTTLPSKPLMVPLLHEMIKQGLSVVRGSQKIMVGEQARLPGSSAGRVVIGAVPIREQSPMGAPPQGQRISLDSTGRPQAPLDRAGVYSVVDQAGQPIAKVAVNVDPTAGETDVQSAAAVTAWLAGSGPWDVFDTNDLSRSLTVADQGSPIAGILLFMVLALLIIETLLARWFSHAYKSEASDQEPEGGYARAPTSLTSDFRPLTFSARGGS
jgi:hypothetical protein